MPRRLLTLSLLFSSVLINGCQANYEEVNSEKNSVETSDDTRKDSEQNLSNDKDSASTAADGDTSLNTETNTSIDSNTDTDPSNTHQPQMAASLILPAPATLLGSSVQFKTDSQLNQWLSLGTSANEKDIFDGGFKGDLTVKNIPQDGSRIFITLWTTVDGNWKKNNYEFLSNQSISEKNTDTDNDSIIPQGFSQLKSCTAPQAIALSSSGLPLLQSNPGAPVAFYLDYDGGTYHSSSSGDKVLGGYNRNGSASNFDNQEQADIIASWQHVSHYFSMFDVNVTTMDLVRKNANAWGWILISEDVSGGRASTSSSAIARNPYARAYAGSSTVRIENSDKSRRLAHELGHNLTLQHSGVWEGDDFYKWEDWKNWDHQYGPIMGGGGEGDRNGWSLGNHSKSKTSMQDTINIIRQRLTDTGGSVDGWRVDDYNNSKSFALCLEEKGAYQQGIIEKPDDLDKFSFTWGGGQFTLDVQAVDVSAVKLDVTIHQGDKLVAYDGLVDLAAGNYTVHVSSKGGYGELGSYDVRLKE